MIVKLIFLLIFTALIAFVITPSEHIKIETLSGNYTYFINYNDNESSLQVLSFYPNQTWKYIVDGHSDSGKYTRHGKNVTITGKFIHENFKILKNKSLRDSLGRVWIKSKQP